MRRRAPTSCAAGLSSSIAATLAREANVCNGWKADIDLARQWSIISTMKRANSSKRPLFVARSIIAAIFVTASVQARSNGTSTSEDAEQAAMQSVVRAVFAHDRL